MSDALKGIRRYSAFFHREPDSVWTTNLPSGSEIAVARYSPNSGGFLRNVFAALPGATLWITSGMSLTEMNVPLNVKRDRRIELSAFLPGSSPFGDDGQEDPIAELLLNLASYPFVEDSWIGPCHTVSFPDPLVSGTDMRSVFFGVLPVDMARLCRCAPGKPTVVASVVPITTAERDWYASKGELMALIDLFEEHDAELHFDIHRASLV